MTPKEILIVVCGLALGMLLRYGYEKVFGCSEAKKLKELE